MVVAGCIIIAGAGTQIELDGKDALLSVSVLVVPVIIEILFQCILVRVDDLLCILCSLVEVLSTLLIVQIVIYLCPSQIDLCQCCVGGSTGGASYVTLSVFTYLWQLFGCISQVVDNLLINLCF